MADGHSKHQSIIKSTARQRQKRKYLHEVDGVSTFKVPAVLFPLHTLEERKRRVQ